MNIRLFKPSIGNEELEAVRDVFERAWLGLGPLVDEFEKAWSAYIGVKHSLGLNSATAALHLALRAFDFPKAKKVLVPAITFASTALAALYNALDVVFVDVDEATLQIDVEDLKRKVTPDSVAVMVVHLGGKASPVDEIVDIARSKGLRVIEDCAHCAGGEYKGRKLGAWGDVGCFSFEEKKCMTTGDGGMLCSSDGELVESLRPWRWVGIDKDTWRRTVSYSAGNNSDSRHWYYDINVPGYKYNMNDLSACIGLVQLKKLDAMNARRREVIRHYLTGLENCQRVKPLFEYTLNNNESYWIFGVRCTERDDLILHLKKQGVATGVHYMPLPLHPAFRRFDADTPVAMKIWHEMVSLPLHADLTDEEVDYVCSLIHDFDHK